MDEKDQLILEKLMKNARKSTKQLAKELNLPRSTVYDRIKKMEDEGIIKKYTAVADYKKLGKPIIVFILAKYVGSKGITQREVGEKIAKLENVVEVHLISGQWDILIKARGRNIDDITRLTIDKLGEMEGIGERQTCTSFVVAKEEYND